MIDTTAEYLHDEGLADPDLAELFAALHAQGSGDAPAMGAELAALLDAPSAPTVLARRRDPRTARRAAAAALLASGLVGVGLGVGAAAVGILPDPAQRVVSDVVGRLTHLELPRPVTSPRQPEPDPKSDSDSGTVAPVDPAEGTTLEPSDPDAGIGGRALPASPGGANQEADEDATGEDGDGDDAGGLDGGEDRAEVDGTSGTGDEGAGRDSSESGTGADADNDSADPGGDFHVEGRLSSGDGEESGSRESGSADLSSGDSGSDGAGEE